MLWIQVDAHLWISRHEGRQHRRDQRACDRERQTDPQGAARHGGKTFERRPRLVDIGEDAKGVRPEQDASVGQAHMPGRAIEEDGTDLLLKPGQCATDP